jgi:hypothetical protein
VTTLRVTTAPRSTRLTFTCLDLQCSFESPVSKLTELVETVFGASSCDHDSDVNRYDARLADDDRTITIECDGAHVLSTTSVRYALDYLVWHVNQRVIASSTSRLLVHAGAAKHGKRAVVVPAPSGGGKSTLVAALVRGGFAYSTDECVAIDAASGLTEGYAKAIGLKQGSWPLFAEISDVAVPSADYDSPTRYATAAMLGGTTDAGPASPAVVLVPERSAGAGNTSESNVLSPIARADALMLLAEQAFNFDDFGRERLPVLARLVTSCDCYRVDVTNLHAAVDAVRQLFA